MPKELTHIQESLAARGYMSEISAPWRRGGLEAGSAIALSFGDQVTIETGNLSRVTIHGSIQINGDIGPSIALIPLAITKTQVVRAKPAIEIELVINLQLAIGAHWDLPEDLIRGTAGVQRIEAYRHMQDLTTDALQTLQSLRLDKGRKGLDGPGMRIAARMLGDLAIGQTGFVSNASQPVCKEYLRHSLAACGWIQMRLLPELCLVMRDLSAQARRAAGYGSAADRQPPRLTFHESATAPAERETVH